MSLCLSVTSFKLCIKRTLGVNQGTIPRRQSGKAAKRLERQNITDDSVTISTVCLLLGLSHLSLCVTNVHL